MEPQPPHPSPFAVAHTTGLADELFRCCGLYRAGELVATSEGSALTLAPVRLSATEPAQPQPEVKSAASSGSPKIVRAAAHLALEQSERTDRNLPSDGGYEVGALAMSRQSCRDDKSQLMVHTPGGHTGQPLQQPIGSHFGAPAELSRHDARYLPTGSTDNLLEVVRG